ncbi:dihydrodipicolinate synthase family protein [Janibacter sp. LM]|uniref:dihydrodipicolinate synthase family protein n=1 Tax=Janibacter sp. LM TaxID=3144845 RepID=UPI0031F5F4EA
MTLSRTTAGVYAIAPTPFAPDGSVDHASLDRLVDFYGEVGVDGLTVLGQLGEAPKLDQDEAVEIARRVIERTDVPVVVGVSAPGFAAMRSLTAAVMDAGAVGVMIAPPNTLRTDDQVVGYYAGAADAIGEGTPFVIQDYPLTFSVQMSPGTIARIARDNPGAVMLKHEDWPGLEKITALRDLEAKGEMPRLSVLTGNGGLFLDYEMERGADGAMTGYCFPDLLVDVVRMSRAGEREAAHDLFDAHLPLMRYEQQPGVGLAVRKYVLQRRGVLASDAQRSPSRGLTPTARAEVDHLLQRLARHDARAAF